MCHVERMHCLSRQVVSYCLQSLCHFILYCQGDTIVTGCADSTIRVFDARSGLMRGTLQAHVDSVDFLEFDGETVVSAGMDRYRIFQKV